MDPEGSGSIDVSALVKAGALTLSGGQGRLRRVLIWNDEWAITRPTVEAVAWWEDVSERTEA